MFIGYALSNASQFAMGIILVGAFSRTARASLQIVGSSRVDLQACKLEYSIVSPK